MRLKSPPGGGGGRETKWNRVDSTRKEICNLFLNTYVFQILSLRFYISHWQ
jgi:hypothetical protein